jgi:hypothetical protein
MEKLEGEEEEKGLFKKILNNPDIIITLFTYLNQKEIMNFSSTTKKIRRVLESNQEFGIKLIILNNLNKINNINNNNNNNYKIKYNYIDNLILFLNKQKKYYNNKEFKEEFLKKYQYPLSEYKELFYKILLKQINFLDIYIKDQSEKTEVIDIFINGIKNNVDGFLSLSFLISNYMVEDGCLIFKISNKNNKNILHYSLEKNYFNRKYFQVDYDYFNLFYNNINYQDFKFNNNEISVKYFIIFFISIMEQYINKFSKLYLNEFIIDYNEILKN